jgi:DNA primase small subunit
MPHSVSSEAHGPDSDVVDMIGADSIAPAVENQDGDNDMAMVKADVQSEEGAQATDPSGHEEKQEVKLEDLFADIESDEEFPSSNAQDVKMSSSPEAPASPM